MVWTADPINDTGKSCGSAIEAQKCNPSWTAVYTALRHQNSPSKARGFGRQRGVSRQRRITCVLLSTVTQPSSEKLNTKSNKLLSREKVEARSADQILRRIAVPSTCFNFTTGVLVRRQQVGAKRCSCGLVPRPRQVSRAVRQPGLCHRHCSHKFSRLLFAFDHKSRSQQTITEQLNPQRCDQPPLSWPCWLPW